MSEGPKPFSTDWYRDPAAPERIARRLPPRPARIVIGVASKLPNERALSILVVLFLVISSFWFAGPRGDAHDGNGTGVGTPLPTIAFSAPEPTAAPDISTDSLQVAEAPEKTAPKLDLQAPSDGDMTNGLIPKNRIITYYGFPGNDSMGVLGEQNMQDSLTALKQQAKAYEAADPTRPVLVGFEVIASVGQRDPQADGSYLLDTPASVLDEYADFCEKNGILLFLDVQIGRRTVSDEVQGLEPWLKKPFVHLAIDPEFAVKEGQVPGVDIGSVDASDITWTQNWLVKMAKDNDLPPKILMVHQFHDGMIQNKDKLAPVTGVQLVIDGDGWGPPDSKRSMYEFVNKEQEIQYNGIKIFYKQDDPILTPEEVVKMDPVPDVVVYQ